MIIKEIKDEDFINYKKPSMFIGFPTCSWKCEKECGVRCCQNGALASMKNFDVPVKDISDRYLSNLITSAIVCGGLEPLDSFGDLQELILSIRESGCLDDIVIYTGYNPQEIDNKISILKKYKNIIIKFGRFIPNQNPHFDEVLGVNLASDNQYAVKIS